MQWWQFLLLSWGSGFVVTFISTWIYDSPWRDPVYCPGIGSMVQTEGSIYDPPKQVIHSDHNAKCYHRNGQTSPDLIMVLVFSFFWPLLVIGLVIAGLVWAVKYGTRAFGLMINMMFRRALKIFDPRALTPKSRRARQKELERLAKL